MRLRRLRLLGVRSLRKVSPSFFLPPPSFPPPPPSPLSLSLFLSLSRDARLTPPSADLAMEITDAEWQWDRRKLTFFYLADQRVDFRELVRELFRLYKTRIWMYVLSSLFLVFRFDRGRRRRRKRESEGGRGRGREWRARADEFRRRCCLDQNSSSWDFK